MRDSKTIERAGLRGTVQGTAVVHRVVHNKDSQNALYCIIQMYMSSLCWALLLSADAAYSMIQSTIAAGVCDCDAKEYVYIVDERIHTHTF